MMLLGKENLSDFRKNPLEWKGTALGDEWLYLQSKHNYTKLKKIGDYWYAK